jgi:hypothetical protein
MADSNSNGNNFVNKIRNAIPAPSDGWMKTLGSVAALIIGAIVLYYLYNFFFSTQTYDSKTVLTTAVPANTYSTKDAKVIPPIVEGGEYSLTFWIYVTNFTGKLGTPKHVLELQGVSPTGSQSTLLVALGHYTNKLMVRVNSNSTNNNTTESMDMSTTAINKLFTDTQTTPGELMGSSSQICDLPSIDLQKWVCIGIVLNGRTVDVYMDGKLARSCVLPSFYKVDPNGAKLKLMNFDGFEGYMSNVTAYAQALNPDQLYKVYMSGPSDVIAGGFLGWLGSVFDIKGEITYSQPNVGVTYSRTSVTF